MENWLQRTRAMLGDDNIIKLENSKICIFGIGGVGGFAAEALARCGIGNFMLIDNDTVNVTNINRQIIATTDTVGRLKTDVMKERILSINSDADVQTEALFYSPETTDRVDLSGYDYIVDAVDHVPAKVEIAVRAQAAGIRVMSSMGAGNKLDPTRFTVSDIYDTKVDPLAKIMRHALREAGVEHLKVVYSDEPPVTQIRDRIIPSVSFAPSVAGLIIASEVVKDICGI